jgi:hypothetical protein
MVKDAQLRAWLHEYAETHPGHGFHRAYREARSIGWVVNHKKV